MPETKPKGSETKPPYFVSVAVVVADRKKALDWYTNVLGLEVVNQQDHWVTVGQKGHGLLHLCQSTEYDPSAKLEPGNSGILFRLPGADFAESCARLKSRGVTFAEEPRHAEWGWYATIRDPDGNEHVVMPDA